MVDFGIGAVGHAHHHPLSNSAQAHHRPSPLLLTCSVTGTGPNRQPQKSALLLPFFSAVENVAPLGAGAGTRPWLTPPPQVPTSLGTQPPAYLPPQVPILCGWVPREVGIGGVGQGCWLCVLRRGVRGGSLGVHPPIESRARPCASNNVQTGQFGDFGPPRVRGDPYPPHTCVPSATLHSGISGHVGSWCW